MEEEPKTEKLPPPWLDTKSQMYWKSVAFQRPIIGEFLAEQRVDWATDWMKAYRRLWDNNFKEGETFRELVLTNQVEKVCDLVDGETWKLISEREQPPTSQAA